MIRSFRPEDEPRAAEILGNAFVHIFKGLKEQLGSELFAAIYGDGRKNRAELLKTHIKNEPDHIVIAERNGKIVGVGTYHVSKPTQTGIIAANGVDPDCGEKGVGQEMYSAILERFRAEGLLYATVTTGLDEAHAPARRAYERVGFGHAVNSVTYRMKL